MSRDGPSRHGHRADTAERSFLNRRPISTAARPQPSSIAAAGSGTATNWNSVPTGSVIDGKPDGANPAKFLIENRSPLMSCAEKSVNALFVMVESGTV